MIPTDAVIYSDSLVGSSVCHLVAQYAGMRVIKRLTETECPATNPVLGRYLGELLTDDEDGGPLPFTLLVGGKHLLGERFRQLTLRHGWVVVDCGGAFQRLQAPKADAPPVCPAISDECGSLNSPHICPEQYACMSDEDRAECDASMLRCHFEEIEDAACPSRPDFREVLSRHHDMIQKATDRNRHVLWMMFLETRDSLLQQHWDADGHYGTLIYQRMLSHLVQSGAPLQFKEAARKLNDDGYRTKKDGDKLFEQIDLQQLLRRLDKTDEWRKLNDHVGGLDAIKRTPPHKRTQHEWLMLTLFDPKQ